MYEITAIWVPSERYDTLDKKVWKKIDGVKLEDGYYVAIAPNKRYKQGKVIASVLLSYKSVANHFEVMEELNIEVSLASRFSITQLLRHKDRIFVYFDNSSELRSKIKTSWKSRLVSMRISLIKRTKLWIS